MLAPCFTCTTNAPTSTRAHISSELRPSTDGCTDTGRNVTPEAASFALRSSRRPRLDSSDDHHASRLAETPACDAYAAALRPLALHASTILAHSSERTRRRTAGADSNGTTFFGIFCMRGYCRTRDVRAARRSVGGVRPDLIELGCNTHARRYFVKALDSGDHRAALPIAAFKRLYDIEEVADKPGANRAALRRTESRPIYQELVSWCRLHHPHEPPRSPLAVACGYLLNHQFALMRFLDDAAIPIDNSLVERLHRRPAIGRRNFLFVGSHAGGDRAAIAYSVLGTCRLIGLNPVAYLSDVLPTLARGVELQDIPALMPRPWKLAHPDAAMAPLA